MNTTAAHTHAVHCATKMVETVEHGVTTRSAEFACSPEVTVDDLLIAEKAARVAYTVAGFGADAATRARGEREHKASTDAFWALVARASDNVLGRYTARRMRIA